MKTGIRFSVFLYFFCLFLSFTLTKAMLLMYIISSTFIHWVSVTWVSLLSLSGWCKTSSSGCCNGLVRQELGYLTCPKKNEKDAEVPQDWSLTYKIVYFKWLSQITKSIFNLQLKGIFLKLPILHKYAAEYFWKL